jgi:transposase
MGVLLGLMRTMGRSLKGLRAYAIKAFYRGKRVTVMAAMSHHRVLALETLDHSMKGDDFRHFIKMQLVPNLWKGAVVVMDNLPAHKVEGIQDMIESVGARIVYLSPYSPEFNPIEHLWSQLKSFLRRVCPKTWEAVDKLLKLAIRLSNPRHFRNWLAHCCYCVS